MFDGLISNNEENKKFALPPWYAPDKKNIFLISLNQYKNINIYISSVYLV